MTSLPSMTRERRSWSVSTIKWRQAPFQGAAATALSRRRPDPDQKTLRQTLKGWLALRVDHPSNVIVERVERGTRQGAMSQSEGLQGAGQAALAVAEAFKKRGNDKFQKGDYCGAIERYDKALNSSDDLPAALAATIHTNRAACFLNIGQNVDVRAAARKALALDSCNKKALFRLGSAQTALGKHQEAVAAFARLAKDVTAGSDVRAGLERANRRLAESQGNFRRSVLGG